MFLLGFPTKHDPFFQNLVMEPANIEYDRRIFENVHNVAKEIEKNSTAQTISYLPPMAQAAHEARFKLQMWKEALEQILAREDNDRNWQSFVSFPVPVEDFLVMCVLQLSKSTWESYYCLNRQHITGGYPVSRSLGHALVQEFLNDCEKSLKLPEPGSSLTVIDRSTDELLRNAGRLMMRTATYACNNFEISDTLYDILSELSDTRYEGAETEGRIAIAPEGHDNIDAVIHFKTTIPLSDIRASRKAMQMTSCGLYVLSDGSNIYGLGGLRDKYKADREDLFEVFFTGQHTWEMRHASEILMRVRHGLPFLPIRTIDEAKLTSIIERTFVKLNKQDLNLLSRLAAAAAKQTYGTILIITDHAEEEAKRLITQGTPIEPIKLKEVLLESVTAIDGAVLLHPNGTCFAIGVILDGLASDKGTPTRGARYNSAIRYVETARKTLGHKCMAIVVSKDGEIDILPKLMPQVRRRLILDKIEEFKSLRKNNEVRRLDFYRQMEWFRKFKYYLWAEICDELNGLRKELEQKLEQAPGWIHYLDFEPNPELDDSYFIED